MNTDTLYNKIEAYLRDEMSAIERASFHQEIESNSELAMEVEKHRKAEVVLQYAFQQRMKDKLNKIDEELGNTNVVTNKPARMFSIGRKWAVAASVLVMLGIGSHFWVNAEFNDTAIAEANYYPIDNQKRGVDNGFEGSPIDAMVKAQEAFESDDFETAIQLLQEVVNGETRLEETAEINLAMAYLEAGQKSLAEKILDQIANDQNHQFYPDAKRIQRKLNGAAYQYAN